MKVLQYLVPGLVMVSIWFPTIRHYYVPGIDITVQMADRARGLPGDEILEELAEFRLLDHRWTDDAQIVRAAEKLLRGEVKLPGIASTRITMPFDVKDIDRGDDGWQLHMAALCVPDVLLRAYKITRREEFFLSARDVILGWASYERSAWLPKGLLWNDHAIAARVVVLTEFWRAYRHRTDYLPDVARTIFQLVARSGQLLTKPGHFTFATNHGVMQNLALWHVCLAFPTLPDLESYKRLASARMRDQMAFYMSGEGVVLEHSAGYQAFGVELMGRVFRYLTLLDEPIPDEWRKKYELATRVYAQLRRPDGSLPMFGDTDGSADLLGPRMSKVEAGSRSGPLAHERNWRPEGALAVYPVAGYSIWWDGLESWPDPRPLAQTVVAWSYFPGHGHKLADEMSVLLWAGGQTWWTNSGYWPYGTSGRSEAGSWGGSNAPHLLDEAEQSTRATRLISTGSSRRLALIELQRSGPEQFVARRQVVHWKPDLWLVIDDFSGMNSHPTITTWTTFPTVTLLKGSVLGSYRLTSQKVDAALTAFILGSPDMSVKHFTGSWTPFAGWVVAEGTPRPAPALVIEHSAPLSWSLAVWLLEGSQRTGRKFVRAPEKATWGGPQEWSISLPLSSGSGRIWRRGAEVFLATGETTSEIESLKLTHSSEPTAALRAISESYESAASKYPAFRGSFAIRTKLVSLLLVILILQELFFWGYRRRFGRHYPTLRILNACGWTAVGAWIHWAIL